MGHELGQTEIQNLQPPVGGHTEVAGLQIAMNNSLQVRSC
jgi:hypothetical protein